MKGISHPTTQKTFGAFFQFGYGVAGHTTATTTTPPSLSHTHTQNNNKTKEVQSFQQPLCKSDLFWATRHATVTAHAQTTCFEFHWSVIKAPYARLWWWAAVHRPPLPFSHPYGLRDLIFVRRWLTAETPASFFFLRQGRAIKRLRSLKFGASGVWPWWAPVAFACLQASTDGHQEEDRRTGFRRRLAPPIAKIGANRSGAQPLLYHLTTEQSGLGLGLVARHVSKTVF